MLRCCVQRCAVVVRSLGQLVNRLDGLVVLLGQPIHRRLCFVVLQSGRLLFLTQLDQAGPPFSLLVDQRLELGLILFGLLPGGIVLSTQLADFARVDRQLLLCLYNGSLGLTLLFRSLCRRLLQDFKPLAKFGRFLSSIGLR